MSWTVNVPVMTILCLVFDVGRVNGDAASLLLWSLIDLVIVGELSSSLRGHDFSDGCRQGSLSMINVTYGHV